MKINEINKIQNHLTWENSLSSTLRYHIIEDAVLRYGIRELLDLGCGKGVVGYQLPDSVFYLGYDFNAEEISVAREMNKHRKNREFRVYDITRLQPQIHRKFQAILITEVLEHLEDDEKVLKITRGLLRDGGIFILTVPNLEKAILRLSALFTGKVRYMHESHIREYTLNDLKDLLQRNGFKIIEVQGVHLQVPKERYFPKALLAAINVVSHPILRYLPSLATWLFVVAQKACQ